MNGQRPLHEVAQRLGVVGGWLGVVAGATQVAVGSRIPDWTGDKASPSALGLLTIVLSITVVAVSTPRHARSTVSSGRLAGVAIWLVVVGALCFTTVGRLWYIPGLLVLTAGTFAMAACGVRELTTMLARVWLRGLLGILGGCALLMAVAAGPVPTVIAGVIAGGALIAAAVLGRDASRAWTLGLILATVPFAVLTWWSLVTPMLTILATIIALGSRSIGRGPGTVSLPDAQADDGRFTDGQGDLRHGSGQKIASVDLCWIPLGSGERVVRASGKVFEALSAFVERRPRRDLYHSALVVSIPEGRFVIEMAPVIDAHGDRRGVVAEGPVGTNRLGRFRSFRYEIRCWRDGIIPDAPDTISTMHASGDLACARRLVDLVPSVPTAVWGRDEHPAGDMWNSNSLTSWLLTRSGVDASKIEPPPGGRAPGWRAGLVLAAAELEHDVEIDSVRAASAPDVQAI